MDLFILLNAHLHFTMRQFKLTIRYTVTKKAKHWTLAIFDFLCNFKHVHSPCIIGSFGYSRTSSSIN